MTTSSEDMVRANARTIYEANKAALDRGILSMWTVYDHPKDFPDNFIARRSEIGSGEPLPVMTADVVTGNLDLIRKSMEMCGLYCLSRDPSDDPVIVETWT
jgi:hypothetical protein